MGAKNRRLRLFAEANWAEFSGWCKINNMDPDLWWKRPDDQFGDLVRCWVMRCG